MLFVIIGVLLILMNLLGIGWPAAWNWEFFGDLWKFCAPFALAALWWVWADKSGLNKRREMERILAFVGALVLADVFEYVGFGAYPKVWSKLAKWKFA